MSGSKKNINDQIAALRKLLGKGNDDKGTLSFLQDDEDGDQSAHYHEQKDKPTIAIDHEAVNDSTLTVEPLTTETTLLNEGLVTLSNTLDLELTVDPAIDSTITPTTHQTTNQTTAPIIPPINEENIALTNAITSVDNSQTDTDFLDLGSDLDPDPDSEATSTIPKAVKTFKPVDFLHFKKHSNDQALLLIKRFLSKHGKPEQNSTELQALKSAIDRIIAKQSKG